MTTNYAGGLRQRLIHDSIYQYIKGGLTALGWFGPGRQHQPINIVDYPIDRNVAIPVNTIAISDDGITQELREVGSELTEFRWTHYMDVYAESNPVGLHLRGDIEGILAGRFPDLGFSYPGVPVYDWTQATPTRIFSCYVNNFVPDHGQDWTGEKPWLAHWYVLRFEVVDSYATDQDTTPTSE